MRSLRYKITKSFFLISITTFVLLSFLINSISEKQFKNYIIEDLEDKKELIVDALKQQYISTGNWNVNEIDNIGVSSLNEGLIVRVANPEGVILWDAMTHNKGMCVAIIERMSENMERQYAGFEGGYTESNYSVFHNDSLIGIISIGYYGPYYFTESDLAFLNTLNKLLILTTLVTGLFSVILGLYTAKRISGPISRVIKTSEQISEGNYNGRIVEKSNTKEIVELTEAINVLAENLGKHESLRKRLTADVAHELRTPIANLQGHLEAMIDGIWAPSLDRLKSCHEETIRLTKIVSDLESIARYEKEGMTLNLGKTNISECILSALKSFENEFRNKNLELNTHISDQMINADKDKLTQVMINIISNAIKYTPEGGVVDVTVTGTNAQAIISIKDNGIGISEEDLPYIFERFYRADKSRSRETGGSGIGLAIVKSIVEAHGGIVNVTSKLNSGSNFTIKLPKDLKKSSLVLANPLKQS